MGTKKKKALICEQLKLLFLKLTEFWSFQWKSGAVKSEV